MSALQIGQHRLASRLTLAPMAGFGDVAMRQLARECGAGLTVSEMVSCRGLVYANPDTHRLLALGDSERPSAVQLFGHQPKDFCQAVSDPRLQDFDIIDINMGCPVPKVTRSGEGSALMRDIVLASQIVRATVQSARGRAVTVKFRLGWADSRGVADFARMCQDCGAAAITIHGRTATQMYRGTADWDAVARAAAAVSIPTIGNGDIGGNIELQDVVDCGCAGFAIGRAALGNLGIFCPEPKPSRAQLIRRHIQLLAMHYPQHYVVTTFRKHFAHYARGIHGARTLRTQINACTTLAQLDALIERFVALLD